MTYNQNDDDDDDDGEFVIFVTFHILQGKVATF